MVANAGIGILCQAIEMSLADWRRQTSVNLDGVFLSVKYAALLCGGRAVDRSSLCRRLPVSAGRQVWPGIARRREAGVFSQRR
jgi:NAD(P)-dependent dehydrogenase (short-subunit alcohol dehydrogenase family)